MNFMLIATMTIRNCAGDTMAPAVERSPQNLLVRFSADLSRTFREGGFWADETIYAYAARHAAANPDRVALRDRHVALTYGELVALADATAADLAVQNLRSGDRIAAWLSSRVEMAAILLACSRDGYVLCPSLHRNHTPEEVEALLQRTQARILFAEEDYGAGGGESDIFERAKGLEHVRKTYRLLSPAPRSTADIAAVLDLTDEAPATPAGQADDVIYLAFTSGTTGEPKGVMHSNNTLLANARSIGADWGFGAQSVIYTLSPLSHNLGFGALVLSLLVGGEMVLHNLPRGASLLRRLEEVHATFIFGVPAHALDLLAEIDAADSFDLHRMKGFRISGAAVPAIVAERLLAHGIVCQSGYGMTEACSHNYTMPDDEPSVIVSTSGRACPGYEIATFAVDDPDRILSPGEIGQIGGRGASLMLGYFDDQTATESSFNADGWFMTGDLGLVDDKGYLQVTGRIKDVIIRGGHNIHPAKIESLAARYPSIERAAAIPIKDERLGEKVCLVVMARGGVEVDPGDLLNHLYRQGLSKYDMPEYFAQVKDIPLSASGKMLKRALLPYVDTGELTPRPVRWSAS